MASVEADADAVLSSGIFTWNIAENTVYADRAAAMLFGLAPLQAASGLPIERFLERVHEDDRPKLAREIAHAVETSQPYQVEYRVCATSKVWVDVIAFGHCFRNADGEPNHFSGIIHPVPVDQEDKDALWHLLAAHEIYRNQGNTAEAAMVLGLLKRLTNPGENPLRVVRLHGEDPTARPAPEASEVDG